MKQVNSYEFITRILTGWLGYHLLLWWMLFHPFTVVRILITANFFLLFYLSNFKNQRYFSGRLESFISLCLCFGEGTLFYDCVQMHFVLGILICLQANKIIKCHTLRECHKTKVPNFVKKKLTLIKDKGTELQKKTDTDHGSNNDLWHVRALITHLH